MRIYKLTANIDGFGGRKPDKYFYHFEDAWKELEGYSGFFYDHEKELWDIEMVKSVWTEKGEDSLSLRGIPYPKSERNGNDPYYINYAEAAITPIDLDGEPNQDRLYILVKRYGYNEYINSSLSNTEDPSDPIYNRVVELNRSFSKSYMKKIARKHKSLARAWNNKEFERRCNIIDGGGDNYMSLLEFKIS